MRRLTTVLSIALSLGPLAVAARASAQDVVLEGRVFIRQGQDVQGRHRVQGALVGTDGRRVSLDLDGLSERELERLARRARGVTASVAGSFEGGREASPLRVRSFSLLEGPFLADDEHTFTLQGAQPFVSILCRFADLTDRTPNDVDFFKRLLGNDYPGQDHFWREVSYGAVTVPGQTVVGWYDLPKNKADYINSDGDWDLDATAQDCAALADPEVDFSQFQYMNFVVNDDVDCCAYGGTGVVNVEGQTEVFFGMTWMPLWSHGNAVFGHEMGHAMNLPHSSGPYQETYDSNWDVMSSGGVCASSHPEFGCVSVHTVGMHKASLGWIPTERMVTVSSGSSTVTLDRLAQPTGTTNPLLVRLPIQGSTTDYYTVEARVRAGYDAEVPGDAVVIHRVDEDDRDDRRAQVVDPDGNEDPNDAGAMWVVGELFSDAENSITVRVDRALGGNAGFEITVTNGSPAAVALDPSAQPAQATAAVPYEFQFAATGGDGSYAWSQSSGDLPEGLALSAAGLLSGTPLAAGDFSFEVTVSSAGQSAAGTVALSVVAPALSSAAVLDQLLGTGSTLSQTDLDYLDLVGNRDGSFDLGDFYAWLRATGAVGGEIR